MSILLLSLALLLPAQSTSDDFFAELKAVETLLGSGNHVQAQQALDALLNAHREPRYIEYSQDTVLELAARCAFERAYERPDLQGVLGGSKRPSWKERSLSLELVFDRKGSARSLQAVDSTQSTESDFTFHPQGFTREDDILYCDVPFKGKCQIEIEGVVPRQSERAAHRPRVVLSVDDELRYKVNYTWPCADQAGIRVGNWTQGDVRQWLKGDERRFESDTTPGIKYHVYFEEKYSIKLVVKSEVLAATLNGRDMITSIKRQKTYGRLGFQWCPEVTRITVKGKVDPRAIEGLYERHRELSRAAFVASANAKELLPDWWTGDD